MSSLKPKLVAGGLAASLALAGGALAAGAWSGTSPSTASVRGTTAMPTSSGQSAEPAETTKPAVLAAHTEEEASAAKAEPAEQPRVDAANTAAATTPARTQTPRPTAARTTPRAIVPDQGGD